MRWKIFVNMTLCALFLFGCSTAVPSTGTLKKMAVEQKKPSRENVAFNNVDKVVYLKRIYEKDGKKFLEFQDMKEYGNKLTSLPIAKEVKVFLPNYYPEDLFAKLQKDLKDPNNKNIQGVLYYLTLSNDEIQAIQRPMVKLPDVEIEFKKEQDPVLEKMVEAYLNDRVDTMTKGGLVDSSQIKFYKNFSRYIVLGRNTDGKNIIDYYIWLQQRQFELKNGVVIDGMGVSLPAALKIKETNGNYEVLSYIEAGDGSFWAPSIQKMYPPKIAKKLMDEYSKKIDIYFPNIEMALKAEAEDYFKKSNF